MSETPSTHYTSIEDNNNNNLKIDEVISEAEKDDIITSEELQEIHSAKNNEKEILSQESLDKISNYEKEVSLFLLANNMKIPDRCITNESAFKEFLNNVSIMSGTNISDRISFSDLDIESTNYLKIGSDGNIEFTIRAGTNSFDVKDKFETNEILNKFEGLSEANFDYINQTPGLNLKNGVVTHTYKIDGVVYSNYFTISKNPNTSKNLGNDNENTISRLGQSQSLKQWTEATIYLREAQLAKKQIDLDNDSEKQTAPEDVQPVMDSKVNTIEKVTDEETSFSESVSETFDNAVDSIVETYNEVKETVLETYEQSVQWLREYFKEFPDAGKIDLGNGEFLEVEYDSKNNKLYVDTQFFDGISDYKSEVDLGDIANKTPEQLKELISDKNAEFLKEYKNAIESKEIQKQNKSILEVFSGNKRFTNVGEVKIGKETMDVRLIRTSDSDVKIKLNTPFGDNISDKDVMLDFASKKSGGFDTMKNLRSSIQEKTKELEKSYKDLYKKNNPEEEAA